MEDNNSETQAAIDCGASGYDCKDQYIEGNTGWMLFNANGCMYRKFIWKGASLCIPNGHYVKPDDGTPQWTGCTCDDPEAFDMPGCDTQPPPPEPTEPTEPWVPDPI